MVFYIDVATLMNAVWSRSPIFGSDHYWITLAILNKTQQHILKSVLVGLTRIPGKLAGEGLYLLFLQEVFS